MAYDRAPVAMHCLWHNRPLDLVGEQDARRFAAIVRADRESERYATAESQYFADHNWEIDPAYVHVIASVEEGDKLYQMAENARIPINCGFDDLVMAPTPEAGAATYQVGDLRLTVLGPDQEQLEALRRKWKKETKDQSLETLFEQSQRIAAIVAADDDRSVTNLSSLVFLVEFAGRSILMTGDARGHYIRDALMRAKRLSRGKVHIDVLKLQHHGSIRNVDTAFFEAVTADEYVISANGEYHNPDEATLAALVEARGQTGFRVWLTNGDAGTKLAPMVAEWRARYPDLVIEVRPSGVASLRIELEAALPS